MKKLSFLLLSIFAIGLPENQRICNTGQNPQSSKSVGKAILKELK